MPIDITTAIARISGGGLTYAHIKDGRVFRIESMTELLVVQKSILFKNKKIKQP